MYGSKRPHRKNTGQFLVPKSVLDDLRGAAIQFDAGADVLCIHRYCPHFIVLGGPSGVVFVDVYYRVWVWATCSPKTCGYLGPDGACSGVWDVCVF